MRIKREWWHVGQHRLCKNSHQHERVVQRGGYAEKES